MNYKLIIFLAVVLFSCGGNDGLKNERISFPVTVSCDADTIYSRGKALILLEVNDSIQNTFYLGRPQKVFFKDTSYIKNKALYLEYTEDSLSVDSSFERNHTITILLLTKDSVLIDSTFLVKYIVTNE